MAVRVLGIDIMSYLKGDGFKKADEQAGRLGKTFASLKGFATSGLGQIVGGYFAVSKVMEEYNKSIEAANYQLEQETKLQTTLKSQGFRQEQIDSIKKYASELQTLGVVGDEVTLAGAQQLATYNLTEENLKKLLPAMQDILVQSKGLNGTGSDAVGVANMLAKGLLGQTGMLEKSGITLNERQKQLIAVGTQEEKVAALVEAVRLNVGEQNKEFLKTPEGKIASVKNNVGDMYENIGMLFRESRAWGYEIIGNNLPLIESFLKTIIKTVQGGVNTILKIGKSIYNFFSSLPPEVKTTIKLITGFFAITTFPIAAGLLLLEDLITAFEGGDSVIKKTYDAVMNFLDIDLTFDDTINNIKKLWNAFEEANGVKILMESLRQIIDNISTSIGTMIDVTKIGIGAIGVGANGVKNLWKWATDDDYMWENVKEDMSESWNNGSGKMMRNGFNSAKERVTNFSERTTNRIGNIKDLYNEGQQNLKKKKNLEDLPKPKLSTSTEQNITYKPSDITINVGNNITEDNIAKIKQGIHNARDEELRALKQVIGGGLVNAQ